MQESKRQMKISKQLQKDLSDIFRKKLGDLFRNSLVTITRVYITPDLSLARVYISIMTSGDSQQIMEKIHQHKQDVRRSLGNRIGKQVRRVPELVFFEDQGAQYASEIEDILSKLDIPPKRD